MFQTLRRQGSVALLLLLSLCAGAVPVPHADGPENSDHLLRLVGHDERAHHFSAASSEAAASEHCFLCHSLRSLHQPQERHHSRELAPESERLHVVALAAAAHPEWSPIAGRAPPSALATL